MKKVCHVTSAHESTDERIFYKECMSLAKAGYESYIVAQGESVLKNKVHIVGVKGLYKLRFLRIIKATKAIYNKALEIDADIYHVHDPELLPYALKLKKLGKKVIFDSHEDIPQQIMEKTWIPKLFRSCISYIVMKYQNNVCKKLDAVVSVTPHICDKFKLVNPKIYMITNYPVLVQCASETDSKRDCQNRTVCFAGGITEQWGHENVLKALQIVGDVKYVLCGFGSDDYIEKLKTISAWNKVDYKGRIPHLEVHRLLSSSGVGMALLRKGGNTGGEVGTLGNTKLFEYMLAGIPVICTDFILWKEIIDEYNCGICVDPCDVEEIANAIKCLLDKPSVAVQMGENGRKAVFDKYNWSGEEKKLLELYKELL